MKFSVNQEELQKSLNYCQGVIEKRSTMSFQRLSANKSLIHSTRKKSRRLIVKFNYVIRLTMMRLIELTLSEGLRETS